MISLAFISYIVVMSITPGPNNLLLTASGVNFGLKRTLPATLGISIGSGLQTFIALQAFSFVEQWISEIRMPIAIIGSLYLLWLSWKIYLSSAPEKIHRPAPATFIQMALFQWVNPKAWLMAVNVAILFGTKGEQMWLQNMVLAAASALLNYPCIFVWAVAGDRLRLALQHPMRLRIFNISMAGMMSLTALWLLFDELNAELNFIQLYS